jgi:signal transduction histidine kinase
MLALLFASLLLTATIVQQTYTPKNSLYQTAQTLEDNLHKKERFVAGVFNNQKSFDQLKTLEGDDKAALQVIKNFTTDENIWLATYKNNKLVFWSGIKVIPNRPDTIAEGFSLVWESNGAYDIVKKTDGNFTALALIPVKLKYPYQNQYLRNTFATNLLKDNNIDIASYTDKNVYGIRSIKGNELFIVKNNPGYASQKFFYFEVISWALCFLVLCMLVQNCCSYLASRYHPYLGIIVLAAFIILLRFVNIQYDWPNLDPSPEIFRPDLYSQGTLYASFGDFCANVLLATWFVGFVYRYRDRLAGNIHNSIAGYATVVGCVGLLIAVSVYLLLRFYSLVVFSKINFDINNVLNLSVYSVIGILMLCFAFLIFYLLVEICLTLSTRTSVPVPHQVAILIIGILFSTLVAAVQDEEFNLFYILWAIWVLIRGNSYRRFNARLNSGQLIAIILVCAIVSAIKLNHFESIKELRIRKTFIQQLQTTDDLDADKQFKKLEKKIAHDPYIPQYFADSVHNSIYLKNYFQKIYFDGYLSRYNVNIYVYNSAKELLSASGNQKYNLDDFKAMVQFSAAKVSDLFYRASTDFGVRQYFTLLPVKRGDTTVLGTLVINLDSEPLQAENTFPELLVDGDTRSGPNFKEYSYALYTDDKLIGRHGDYDYSQKNNDLKGKVREYVYKTTLFRDLSLFSIWSTYDHLIFKPNRRDLVVVSKQESPFIDMVTSVTFFFIVFLAFSALVILTRWFWGRMKIMYIEENYFHWVLKLNFDNILYKTRIQLSIVFAVTTTLVLVGLITYASIAQQYDEQQNATISDRITHIGRSFENANLVNGIGHTDQDFQNAFNQFASTYSSDLTLYSLDGRELVSTQPKIYDFKLIAPRINARAYIALNRQQRNEFTNQEIIGTLNYKAGYVPVKNKDKTKTIGYLELPYFSNQADYNERLGSLLNAMINIYALIFIGIGLLAIIIARQITAPLNIIEHGLRKTIYGQKNEPIKWKRNDEIGTLVKEYNNMIAALEQSAQKLAQSERESAWREMAKQVAHEIKNPLTPLKLGLQLLEKSWKDKDPKFDQKFERFSKSFVEQIESLSSIASEFSAFAKMPDTRIERMDIFGVLTQAVVVFKQMDNIRILYKAPEEPFYVNADRDQLLRSFNNLLKNAIEAIPPGQQGLIEIGHVVTGRNILLYIKDNGNGIAEHQREKIFMPNFTTKSSGTGLGLAFVKNSIENAGGKVWFETITGEGTTFHISLPGA